MIEDDFPDDSPTESTALNTPKRRSTTLFRSFIEPPFQTCMGYGILVFACVGAVAAFVTFVELVFFSSFHSINFYANIEGIRINPDTAGPFQGFIGDKPLTETLRGASNNDCVVAMSDFQNDPERVMDNCLFNGDVFPKVFRVYILKDGHYYYTPGDQSSGSYAPWSQKHPHQHPTSPDSSSAWYGWNDFFLNRDIQYATRKILDYLGPSLLRSEVLLEVGFFGEYGLWTGELPATSYVQELLSIYRLRPDLIHAVVAPTYLFDEWKRAGCTAFTYMDFPQTDFPYETSHDVRTVAVETDEKALFDIPGYVAALTNNNVILVHPASSDTTYDSQRHTVLPYIGPHATIRFVAFIKDETVIVAFRSSSDFYLLFPLPHWVWSVRVINKPVDTVRQQWGMSMDYMFRETVDSQGELAWGEAVTVEFPFSFGQKVPAHTTVLIRLAPCDDEWDYCHTYFRFSNAEEIEAGWYAFETCFSTTMYLA